MRQTYSCKCTCIMGDASRAALENHFRHTLTHTHMNRVFQRIVIKIITVTKTHARTAMVIKNNPEPDLSDIVCAEYRLEENYHNVATNEMVLSLIRKYEALPSNQLENYLHGEHAGLIHR